MKRATRLTLSCAVLSLIGVPALAQQDGAMSGIDPKALTCADIVTMDPEQVPGALYFVAGYMHGSDAGGTDAAKMPEATTAPATTAPAATDPAASGTDTGAEGAAEGADAGAMTGTATAPDAGGGAADPGTSAMDDTATTGSTTAAPETADAPAATGSATGSATGADPAPPATDAASDDAASDMAATETGMVMVDGMFAIPLADVVTMCTQSPEMLVSDALVQHRDGAGTTTN